MTSSIGHFTRRASWFVLAIAVCCLASAPVFAQGLTAVTGRVTDPTGAVIPGVEVTVTNSATGAVRTTVSNETGIYNVTQLQPGTYSIKAELQGFKTKLVNNVPLPVNETATVNLPLEVGAVTDVVDVVASAEVLNTVNSQLGVGFDEKKIIDLPLNARNIVGLLSLQAGVTVSDKSDEFGRDDGGQVNGARNDQQNIVLDGVNINAQERGSALEGALPTTLDSVQEFLVQTAGGGGAAQRGAGGQVQLVTKSGSNEWHGSAYEFYRTHGTSARNYFATVANRGVTPLIRHLPGASMGGPIQKDKVFLFGAFERNTDRSGQLVNRNVPTPQFLDGQVRYRRRDGTFGVITDGPNGALGLFSQIPGDRWNSNMIGSGGILERFRPFSTTTSEPGVDGGANVLVYRFNAPFIRDRNVYISRLDYNFNANHTFYLRGTMNDDVRTLSAETFPGFNNARERIDNSKGFAQNWNWVLSPTLNSNFTWGLTRESFEDTGNNQPVYNFPLFSQLIQTAGAERQYINTWNVVENLSWLKGNHNLQFGGNFRYIDNFLRSFQAVNPGSYSAAANLTANNIGTASSPGLRRALGDAEFARVADPGITGDAVLAATGSVTQFSEDVQYDLNGRRLQGGVPFVRNFRLQEYDFYIQDTWKVRPNFTLTYGVNYSVQTPPYEASGLQVNWTENLGQRLKTQSDTPKTVTELPLYTVQLMGRKNSLPDYYTMDTNNWGPRVSFAWTSEKSDGFLGAIASKGGQLVVRGGYQLAYDRIGGRFARDAALLGSIGLKTRFGTPGFTRSFDGIGQSRAQRIGPGGALPRGNFPVAPDTPDFKLPVGAGGAGGVSTSGIDSGIHNPQNHLVNLTISKELPGGWVIEASYVGRFARDLVGQVDLATPVNIRDTRSGMSFYDAIKEMYTKYEFNSVPVANVQAIAWFENVYPEIKAYAERTLRQTFTSSTQAFYALIHKSVAPGPNSQTSLTDEFNQTEADLRSAKLLSPQAQFFGLFGNLSYSNYNSGQFSVRKRFGQGYTFTGNYTWSKSLDVTSAAEARGNRANGTTGEGLAEDPYNPKWSYALSDFDRAHQFNANFLAELPFGKGKLVATNASGVLQHIIGGWQVSGIVVGTSGRPFSLTTSNRFNHHFFGRSIPHLIRDVPNTLTKENGRVYIIGTSDAERNDINRTAFVNTFPGSSIARNYLRGPNFFNFDASITKDFNITEDLRARFRWETFNAFNHPNFAIPSTTEGNSIDRFTGRIGRITDTSGNNERVMQFSLRIEW